MLYKICVKDPIRLTFVYQKVPVVVVKLQCTKRNSVQKQWHTLDSWPQVGKRWVSYKYSQPYLFKWNHHFNPLISKRGSSRSTWYVIFWFLSGFMVDTLLVSPECSVFSWTPLTSHRWPTPTTANVWWFPAVNYHLFLECPLRLWCFADTLFLLPMMPLMTQWNCLQFWRIWLKGTPPKMDGLPTIKPQMLRLLPPTFL